MESEYNIFFKPVSKYFYDMIKNHANNVWKISLPPERISPHLHMLENLLDDRIVEAWYAIKNEKRIYSTSIAETYNLFDGLLFYDKIILPYPKKIYEEYDTYEHTNILNFKVTKGLLSRKILDFNDDHNELYFNKTDFLFNKLIKFVLTDARISILDETVNKRLYYPNRVSDYLLNIDTNIWYSKVESSWIYPGWSVNAIYDLSYSIASDIPLLQRTHNTNRTLLINNVINKKVISSYNYVMNKFKELRYDINETFIMENLISNELFTNTPLFFHSYWIDFLLIHHPQMFMTC